MYRFSHNIGIFNDIIMNEMATLLLPDVKLSWGKKIGFFLLVLSCHGDILHPNKQHYGLDRRFDSLQASYCQALHPTMRKNQVEVGRRGWNSCQAKSTKHLPFTVVKASNV